MDTTVFASNQSPVFVLIWHGSEPEHPVDGSTYSVGDNWARTFHSGTWTEWQLDKKRWPEDLTAELEAAAMALIEATVDGGSGTIRLPDNDRTRALLMALREKITAKLAK